VAAVHGKEAGLAIFSPLTAECVAQVRAIPDATSSNGDLEMASLYKKPIVIRDPKTGERITLKSQKWWGRYRTADGRERRVPLANDKTAALTMLKNLIVKAEREAAGLEDPFEKHCKRPLSEHVAEFKKHLFSKGNTPTYVNQAAQRLNDLLAACKFERMGDISASRVQERLAEMRASGTSICTSNHYLRAIKMFTRWLVRDRRTNDDRLGHLSNMNAAVDRRLIRRPLSMEEFGLILQAAEAGKTYQDISGPDRAMLYIVGAYTGYRRNEIGSVSRQSFDLESDPPTLTVAAGHSKRRRVDVIPLRSDFAERIRTWLVTKANVPHDRPVFEVSGKRTAELIRRDMTAAREKWLKDAKDEPERKEREKSSFLLSPDQSGQVVDFHALRKTFITNLTRSGAAPKTAQTLARHSDINLTMNVYTMLGVQDQVSAVEALPPIPVNPVTAKETAAHHPDHSKRAG
jgi:integrase